MNITEIAFTLLPVTNLDVSRRFYEDVLGLKASHVFQKDGMGMIEYDVGPATLTIGCGTPLFKPGKEAGAIGLEVGDFPRAISDLKKAGCRFALDAIETPVCHMAVALDPDGNQLIIHKRKAGASH
jgi:predicted enzyme related to lactoylglutathione lyase